MYKSYGKRLLDIIIVLSSVLVLCPFILIIAFMIKSFDPGPVLFKQQRVGCKGINFWFYKFRSMPVTTGDIASDQIGKVKLTWIGKVIRRTNLDELPQLLNILKGDMSVVGPRPPIPNQEELVAIRRRNGALVIRPGLTGLAQINSFDGMSVADKANFDEIYAKRITLLSDLKIIFSTFRYLLKSPPIY